MRLDNNVNTVLNDIMAGEGNCSLLFAPSTVCKEDFISELSQRYFKCFWFSPKIDDMYEICMTLADRILDDVPETRLRLRQLLFCNSQYNGPKAVIRTVLEHVKSLKREVLVVFEDMELLDDDYDFSLLLYFINNAPSNLKIIVSASNFLTIGLYGFEPKYPSLIDEKILSYKEDEYTYEEYVMELDNSQKAFLTYISDVDIISEKTLESIYPEGAGVVKYLSRKGVYVRARAHAREGDTIFIFDEGFTAYLKENKEKYASYLGDYAKENVQEIVATALREINRDYFEYTSYAIKIGSYAHAEQAIERIFHCSKHVAKLPNYLRAHKDLLRFAPSNEYPYVSAMKICLDTTQNVADDNTLSELARLKEYFIEKGDVTTTCILATAECQIYDKRGDSDKVLSIIREVKENLRAREEYKYLYVVIILMMPNFPRYSTIKASEIEANLRQAVQDEFWYFKAVEDLGFYYYASGNYRKALALATELHNLLSSYVIPPRLIATGYFDSTDLNLIEKRVDEAIAFSLENGLDEEIHMLYTAKALIYGYRGEKTNSHKYSDLSLKHVTKEDSYEKFFTIMVRVWQHARAGEHKYAHDLATVYLAYTRARASEYSPYMLSALSYALFKMGSTEEAYSLAKEGIKTGTNRSVAWLMCMGIVTHKLLERGEIREVDALLTNLIRTTNSHGMLRLIIDFALDVFAPILDYAEKNGIESESIGEVMAQVRLREGKGESSAAVKINMFGDVYITVDGKELQWKTRKSKDLFLHYVLAGEMGIDRNVILDCLWKDYLYESAINNLKTTNNIIRKTLDAAGVKYKISYINSRYSIRVDNLENDLVKYRLLVENYMKEPDILHKAELMDDILKIYKADFATDIAYSDFEHERVSIKQELVINMIKLIRGLAKAGEYVESKRFLNSLMLIDGDNDYNHMVYELDKFINLTK